MWLKKQSADGGQFENSNFQCWNVSARTRMPLWNRKRLFCHKLFLLECKKDLKIHNISTLETTIDTIEENSKELMTCLDDKLFEIKHQLMFVLDAITKYRKVLAEIDQEVSINYKCPCLYPVKDNAPKCNP